MGDDQSQSYLFGKIAIIGGGLIGSSLARAIWHDGIARTLAIGDADAAAVATIQRLGFCNLATTDLTEAVDGAELVMLAVPVGTMGALTAALAPHLMPGAILTDVGSTKVSVIKDVARHVPDGVHFVPGHPIAGTEFSGPEAGFAELFRHRWCVLTPVAETPLPALGRVQALWTAVGAEVTIMEPGHHDRVLAMTSHLPHLIAYSIVNAAADAGEHMEQEVLQYSAGGFRGFTRIAQEDPVMWRDIFLNNREALLEQLHLLQEDLAAMTRAIRFGDTTTIEARLSRAREIRRGLKE